MEDITKEYSNGEVTVVWQPKKCIHSANCFRGLPKAFNPKEKPWITLENINSEEIMAQVFKCPSGALSIKEESKNKVEDIAATAATEVVIIKNGPLMVKGNMTIKHKDGKEEIHKEVYLCRCGQSGNKPYCDGSHKKCGFKDE